MNRTELARVHDMDPKTAYRRFRQVTLPVPAVRVEPWMILVNAHAPPLPRLAGWHACAGSTHDLRGNLERRVARLKRWAQSAGMPVVRWRPRSGRT